MAKQISVDEELVLKWFEMRQLRLPSATLASLISPFLSANFKLSDISNVIRIADKAEFVMNIYFEEHFSDNAVK
jgi:ubiquinone biosynthesis protein COQ4